MKKIVAKLSSVLLILTLVLFVLVTTALAEDTKPTPLTINLSATHRLIDEDGTGQDISGLTYKLNVTNISGDIISTATAGSDGKIVFDKPITITEEGYYYYYLSVDAASSYPGVIFDDGYYLLYLDVTTDNSSDSPELRLFCYYIEYYTSEDYWELSDGRYDYKNLSQTSFDISFTDSEDYWISRPVTNLKLSTTNLTVRKVWSGTDETEPVTVDLMRNGNVFDTQVLSADNSWTYTWNGLIINDEEGNAYSYEVIERTPSGYSAKYQKRTVATNVEPTRYWAPLDEGEDTVVGEKYLIIGGQYTYTARTSRGIKAYYFSYSNMGPEYNYTWIKESDEIGYYISDSFNFYWTFVQRGDDTVLRYFDGYYLKIDPDNSTNNFSRTADIDEATPVWLGGSFLGTSINNHSYMITCTDTYNDLWECVTIGKGTSYAGRFFKIREVRNGLISAETTITITNSPESDDTEKPSIVLRIIKRAKDTDKVLQGAKYTVYDVNGDIVGITEPTDSDGKTSFTFDKVGKYTIKETTAPEGYLLSDDVYEIEVVEGEVRVVSTPIGRGYYTYTYETDLTIRASLEDGAIINRDDPIPDEPDEPDDEEKDDDIVDTGDHSQIYFYSLIMRIAFFGFLISLFAIAKRR